jgi:hypothetical protein
LALVNISNSFAEGFVVGFLGALIAIFNFNISQLNVRLDSNKKPVILEKIDYIIPSVANGFFLGILFFSQSFLVFLPTGVIGLALLGFLSVLITLIICFTFYNHILSRTKFKVGAIFYSKHLYIDKVSIIRFSIYAALFELFIMPLISLFIILFNFLPNLASFAVSGFLSGFIGSILGSIIFNRVGKRFPIWFYEDNK